MTTIAQPHGDPDLGTHSSASRSAAALARPSRTTTSSGTAPPRPSTSARRSSPADPVTGTLLAFATLGIGFAARPIGGIVGGYLGDKIGRAPSSSARCSSWASRPS